MQTVGPPLTFSSLFATKRTLRSRGFKPSDAGLEPSEDQNLSASSGCRLGATIPVRDSLPRDVGYRASSVRFTVLKPSRANWADPTTEVTSATGLSSSRTTKALSVRADRADFACVPAVSTVVRIRLQIHTDTGTRGKAGSAGGWRNGHTCGEEADAGYGGNARRRSCRGPRREQPSRYASISIVVSVLRTATSGRACFPSNGAIRRGEVASSSGLAANPGELGLNRARCRVPRTPRGAGPTRGALRVGIDGDVHVRTHLEAGSAACDHAGEVRR